MEYKGIKDFKNFLYQKYIIEKLSIEQITEIINNRSIK